RSPHPPLNAPRERAPRKARPRPSCGRVSRSIQAGRDTCSQERKCRTACFRKARAPRCRPSQRGVIARWLEPAKDIERIAERMLACDKLDPWTRGAGHELAAFEDVRRNVTLRRPPRGRGNSDEGTAVPAVGPLPVRCESSSAGVSATRSSAPAPRLPDGRRAPFDIASTVGSPPRARGNSEAELLDVVAHLHPLRARGNSGIGTRGFHLASAQSGSLPSAVWDWV